MKYLRIAVSVLLTVIMGLLSPLSVFAAGPEYVSDVMVCEASSFEEARAELEKKGYEIVENGNLNAALDTGVYLGYRTTDDPDEAITDIAAMNMLGNYSYGDYEALLAKHRGVVFETVRNFETAVAEFQTNFANGRPEAQMAFDAVNLFRDDDSGKLMGDYLLDYDFSAAAQEQLTDTLMQANSDIVMSIMQTVSMAVDTEETTLLERLSESDPDGLLEKYMGVYPSVAKAQRAIEADYSAAATVLRAWWNDFYSYLCRVEAEDFVKNDDGTYSMKAGVLDVSGGVDTDTAGLPDALKASVEGLSYLMDSAALNSTVEDVSLFLLLSETPYDGGTLLDFFLRPIGSVGTSELYPVVDAMSEAQRAQLEILGIRATLLGAGAALDENADGTQETVDGNAEEKAAFEPVSIFSDVDRSVFENGVAVTGRAELHEQQTGESFLTEFTGLEMGKRMLGAGAAVSTVVTLATLAAGIRAGISQSRYMAAHADEISAMTARVSAFKDTADAAVKVKQSSEAAIVGREGDYLIVGLAEDVPVDGVKAVYGVEDSLNGMIREYRDANAELNRLLAPSKNFQVMKCVSFIVFAVALAMDIYFVTAFFTTGEPSELDIPHHLVSAADTEYGEDYVYYETVKNQNGEPTDVNGHGKDKPVGWLVLYQTKEKGAGKPILARDLRVMTGSAAVDEDTSYIHMFDETGALNLTDARYTGKNDSVNGTYVLFSRDANAYAGSAISGGIAALCAAGGVLVGLAGGILLSGLKKKKEIPA